MFKYVLSPVCTVLFEYVICTVFESIVFKYVHVVLFRYNIHTRINITSINIVQKSDKRIAADVELNYQDKLISSSGEILSETVIPSLKVKYIIGKNKKNWLIVDYISGN